MFSPSFFYSYPLGRDLEKCHAGASFSRKGEMLVLDGDSQNDQLGELRGFSGSFICAVFGGTVAESESTDQLSLWDTFPSSLWAMGRIHSATPVKIQIDPSKPLPTINIL